MIDAVPEPAAPSETTVSPSAEPTSAVPAPAPIIKETVLPDHHHEGEDGVLTLGERVTGVLFRPVETFSRLDERAGWLAPWLAIMGAGVLVGLVALARIDFAAIVKQQIEQQAQPGAPAEALEMGGRVGVFMARMSLFAMPILGSLLGALVVGGVMFGCAAFLGGRRDFLRAFVAAFHASLVVLVRDAAALLGFIAGNPFPQTNLTHLAPQGNLWAAWFLGWLDPIFWWWVVLLAIALHRTLEVPRRKAIVVSGVLSGATVIASALPVLMAGAFKMGAR